MGRSRAMTERGGSELRHTKRVSRPVKSSRLGNLHVSADAVKLNTGHEEAKIAIFVNSGCFTCALSLVQTGANWAPLALSLWVVNEII